MRFHRWKFEWAPRKILLAWKHQWWRIMQLLLIHLIRIHYWLSTEMKNEGSSLSKLLEISSQKTLLKSHFKVWLGLWSSDNWTIRFRIWCTTREEGREFRKKESWCSLPSMNFIMRQVLQTLKKMTTRVNLKFLRQFSRKICTLWILNHSWFP